MFLLGFGSFLQKPGVWLGSMGFIVLCLFHGDEMLQKAEIHVVFMRRAESSEGGSEVTAMPTTAAMARHFRAILSRKIE